jgi:hypothetical protein
VVSLQRDCITIIVLPSSFCVAKCDIALLPIYLCVCKVPEAILRCWDSVISMLEIANPGFAPFCDVISRMVYPFAKRLMWAYPALPDRAGVADALKVPSFRR